MINQSLRKMFACFGLLAAASTQDCFAADPNNSRGSIDPKFELKQVQALLRNRRVFEARTKLQALCGRPDATPVMYCLLAETFLDFEGTEDNAPGAAAAMQGLNVAIAKDPNCAKAYRDLAALSNMKGNYADAAKYATKALSITPLGESGDALRQRALAYSHLNRMNDALADVDAFIAKGRPTSVNYMLRGDLLQALKRYKEAVDSYRLALSKSHTYQDRSFNQLLKCLTIDGNYANAIDEVTRQIVKDPDHAELYDTRGQFEMKLKKFPEAVRDFSLAITNMPTLAYYEHRAAAYDALGEKKLADADRNKTKKMKDDNFQFF